MGKVQSPGESTVVQKVPIAMLSTVCLGASGTAYTAELRVKRKDCVHIQGWAQVKPLVSDIDHKAWSTESTVAAFLLIALSCNLLNHFPSIPSIILFYFAVSCCFDKYRGAPWSNVEHTVAGEGIAKVGSRCWLRVGVAGKNLTAQERLDEATKQIHQGTKCIKGLSEAKHVRGVLSYPLENHHLFC